MKKQKSKSLKPAASLSSSLLRAGGRPRDAGGPKPPPAPRPPSELSALPRSEALSDLETRIKAPPVADEKTPRSGEPSGSAVPGLEPDAFDGLIPGLLSSEVEAARAEKRPESTAPPRLQDQFEFLQSRNRVLADKQADRPKAALAGFLRNLRGGRFADAELDFARIMTLEPQVARKILYHAEIEDLAVICRAIGFKSLEFATIVALLRGAKGNRGLSAPDQLKTSLGIFETIDRDCAMELLEHIPELPRRNWSALKRA